LTKYFVQIQVTKEETAKSYFKDKTYGNFVEADNSTDAKAKAEKLLERVFEEVEKSFSGTTLEEIANQLFPKQLGEKCE
jgi:hypothetical protein